MFMYPLAIFMGLLIGYKLSFADWRKAEWHEIKINKYR